ncbi:TrbI/VirB10 family protein [Muricoccus vinaceus]|uniref:TrbI/VirB10 family protein n=1 Tax=Muricoccus vinaceus TaxID=424704 RepID=A0ABV6IZU0_9PROT
MSGSLDPQRIANVPGRPQPRRLGKLPLVIAGGSCTVALGVLAWVLVGVASQQQVASSAPPSDLGGAAPAGDFLTGEDPSLIRAAARTPEPDRVSTPSETPRSTNTSANTGATQRQPDVHEQARLQAWQQYYTQLAEMRDQRRRSAMEAMGASMAPQQATQASAGGSGVGAAAAGGVAAQPRPGTLDQGPASAATLYAMTAPIPAQSPYELKRAVSVIRFQLDQDVSTGAAGQFSATVKGHVTDYASGNHILVPDGARLIGVYEDGTGPNDERMKVSIVSITYPPTGNPYCPGGEEMPIGSMPAGDGAGTAGMADEVSRHTGRRLFNALIRGIGGSAPSLAGLAGGGAGYGPGQAIASQMAMQGGNAVGGNLTDPGPTFTVRAGFRGTLQLTRSIAFDSPWQPGLGFCGNAPGAAIQ